MRRTTRTAIAGPRLFDQETLPSGPPWAEVQIIHIGTLTNRFAEIQAGLDPGNHVIAYPSDQVRDGVRVRQRSRESR